MKIEHSVKLTSTCKILLISEWLSRLNSFVTTYYTCHLCGLTVPAVLCGAGQGRSILAIKQCSVNTPSLEQAFCTGGDAIFRALTALGISTQWEQIAVNCFFNLLPIVISTAHSAFLKSSDHTLDRPCKSNTRHEVPYVEHTCNMHASSQGNKQAHTHNCWNSASSYINHI